MLFTILIPSIPSRLGMLAELYKRLQAQVDKVAPKDVEILSFLDNKRRSVGLKRDGLVQLAHGDFLAFVDDDDVVYDDYVLEILNAIRANPNADVIVFNEDVSINGGNIFTCRFGIEYENQQCRTDANGKWQNITRKPFQSCVWRTPLAQSEHFPNVSWGEDWDWCKRLIPKVKIQHRIEKTLMCYRYSDRVTEADTTGAIITNGRTA